MSERLNYVTESKPRTPAYTATHGEAEEDCKAPSSAETGAKQQGEWEVGSRKEKTKQTLWNMMGAVVRNIIT